MSKRSKRRLAGKQKAAVRQDKASENEDSKPVRKAKKGLWRHIYEDQYKILLLIPMLMLLAGIIQIGAQYATTGDIMQKDVSLKGGMTVTVPVAQGTDISAIESALQAAFPEAGVSVRTISSLGESVGLIIDADITHDYRKAFVTQVEATTGVAQGQFSVEEIGSSLGDSFFRQAAIALLIAFVFMGLVVFLYFKSFVPSMAVILAAFSDIVVTLAIVNILGIKVSTAGIAAFLMLIGYSVDTDILLSTRMLKRTEGTLLQRMYDAIKTGLTLNFTTLVAVIIGMVVSKSEVLIQIFTIIFIGLLVDMVNTWIQNVGIIRLYLEKKNGKD
ncbi:MAG: protein translocase subunit SecF [archaeon]